MKDPFQAYKKGMARLLETMGKNHPREAEARTLQRRLEENIWKAQTIGDDDGSRARRAEILYNLDQFAKEEINQNFDQLCSSGDDPPTLESSSKLSVFFLTKSCEYVTAIQREAQIAYNVFLNEKEIWPFQCSKITASFRKLKKPLLPNDILFSALEMKLFYLNEQVRRLIQLIDRFSPHGREQTEHARNERQALCQKVDEFIQDVIPALDLVNSLGKSIPSFKKCV